MIKSVSHCLVGAHGRSGVACSESPISGTYQPESGVAREALPQLRPGDAGSRVTGPADERLVSESCGTMASWPEAALVTEFARIGGGAD